MHKTESKA
ncbi:hypothetical protein MTR67_005716 [Solanum verrucosum]|uniref:Uncharacterized protein n=1 Tax=Solanum verrucosum TaxID=315347 RepID=A0AAF0PWK5_SOLVR|nr:hypothetical protein MTR67_005713 [Solanum verrucosum]WMV12331.1 hypothetical protein MTR67_005716 [Solanum verrucosum]